MALPSRPTAGMTMMEVVVAITIILIIMVGVTWAFIELLDSHDKARARMEATANARNAMEVLTADVKRAKNVLVPFSNSFYGTTTSSAGDGDRIDNDQDGAIDEERMDGADNDGDWVLADDDKHAILAPPTETLYYTERPTFYRHPDLDDGHIDEDLGATDATMNFLAFDTPGDPLNRRVTFYVGNDADGTPNTLMRQVTGIDPITSASVTTTGPICHNVHSFGLLFWDYRNAKTPTANPWQTKWPPTTGVPPGTYTPSSVYIRLSVYAGKPYSLTDLPANREIDTVTLTTVVNVESVLASPAYVTQRTPISPAWSTSP